MQRQCRQGREGVKRFLAALGMTEKILTGFIQVPSELCALKRQAALLGKGGRKATLTGPEGRDGQPAGPALTFWAGRPTIGPKDRGTKRRRKCDDDAGGGAWAAATI